MGVTETRVERRLKKKLINRAKEFIKKHKKIAIGVIVFLCVLFIIYLGMVAYFMKHFYFGSEINGINISGKTVEQVNEKMATELVKYNLNLKERGGKTEQIKAEEIGLKYNLEGDFKSFKEQQNPYKWIWALFNKEAHKMAIDLKHDDNMLKERIDKLSCFETNTIIEPKNAEVKYENNNYVIVDEVPGTKVDKDILYKHISETILKEGTILDFEAIDCYVKPEYTSKSQKVIDARDMLNKYISSKVTYTIGDQKEILDGSKINEWITMDESYAVKLDEGKVKEFVDALSKSYDTIGSTRNFTASSGKVINVKGGDYGWKVNKSKETETLVAAIKEGKTLEKEPAYIATAFALGKNDIGSTYVEIDLTKQHMWFYKNGALIAQGDVVTGNVSSKNTTPPGIYKLKYKERNATLDGPDYSVPVNFWMPFNGGIGIHDASWRNAFGGSIYKTNGSHGCVNSPYNLAKAIFDNITPGTPVVCYN
ncbi:L,D-transpeptidase/peptidoglycan binding protein [Clostridium swellfunianum]|uniref:L,D-transpeptidase family protein n=1 Tax=Clostridium swellfunianum TaxID=1367462 RepID=UPI00202F43EE|nr:peptidoglycan binding domain-containing protein [Clostridium swellfunianum]MCM0648036.1 L,D-transpeptidase/peptidoglycan binding protein [Clostridium swellfunianum]